MSNNLDVKALLDPAAAEFLAQFPIDLGMLSNESLAVIRDALGQTPAPELSGNVEKEDHQVSGAEHVVVRVHRPKGSTGARPCVYWMHGGGLVLGSYEGDDARFDRWCQEYDCVGVSVEYRLAPECPYPGPIEDCYAGLKWVHTNAAALGIDPGRIGVAGASAGAGLAAALALVARDRAEIAVRFQLLMYPMLDDRQITASSHWADPIWPRPANTFGWTSYLGSAKGGADVSGYAAPARSSNLEGLPPTWIGVGALDGFSDEDTEYATRLRHSGVPVEFHIYPGMPHGFDALMPAHPQSTRAVRDMEEWLAAQLRHSA
jgi:acetyl esterase/lipase